MSRKRKPRSKPIVRSRGDSRLSPEVDLLECLSAEPLTLAQACLPFSSIAHAQRVVAILLKTGGAQLVFSDEGVVVPDWQVTQIIDDLGQWSAETTTGYRLRLTEKGYEQFMNDSERFFDELFRAS